MSITPAEWKFYDDNGYVVLGKILNDRDPRTLIKLRRSGSRGAADTGMAVRLTTR